MDEAKKQEEMKPVQAEWEGGGWNWWHVCGECHGVIDWKDQICPHCKTPIQWEYDETNN